MSSLKVIITGSNRLATFGLRRMLNEVFDVDAHIVDAGDLDALVTTVEPDLFFIDTATFIARLSFFLPRKAKTVLLAHGSHDTIDHGIRLLNTHAQSESQLVNALNVILEQHVQASSTGTTLTAREIDVLRLIASGKINKEIAQELNISVNTVLSHRKNITAKLGIKSVSGLSFYAMMNGIV